MSFPLLAASKVVAVTPADTGTPGTPLGENLWIGVAGTLSFIPYDSTISGNMGGAQATSVGVGLFPVKVMRVNATGTSASSILGLS